MSIRQRMFYRIAVDCCLLVQSILPVRYYTFINVSNSFLRKVGCVSFSSVPKFIVFQHSEVTHDFRVFLSDQDATVRYKNEPSALG